MFFAYLFIFSPSQYKDTPGCRLFCPLTVCIYECTPVCALQKDGLSYCELYVIITGNLIWSSPASTSKHAFNPGPWLTDCSSDARLALSVLAPLCHLFFEKQNSWSCDTDTHLSPNIMGSCRHCVHASWNHCSQRKHCNIFRYHLRGDRGKR